MLRAILLDDIDYGNADVKVFKDGECVAIYKDKPIVVLPFKSQKDMFDQIPIDFLENCKTSGMTIKELMDNYDLTLMYGGDIVNWIVEEWKEYESNSNT